MQMPEILQGESLTRLVQGAVAGAVVTMVVGFRWGGWSHASEVSISWDQRALRCRRRHERRPGVNA